MDDGVGLENQCSDLSLPWVRIPPSPPMAEIHPFGNFVPKNSRYLILGSFPGKPDKTNDWFYGSIKNQFWTILESVYRVKLDTKVKKQALLGKLHFAIADIILSCSRDLNTNSDTNLANIIFNTKAILRILNENKIQEIFFTSRFVEKLFNKQFPNITEVHPEIEMCTLPSPSPRFAKLPLSQKIRVYRKLLPVTINE